MPCQQHSVEPTVSKMTPTVGSIHVPVVFDDVPNSWIPL